MDPIPLGSSNITKDICSLQIEEEDAEKDITFYKGFAKDYLTITPGMFAIFFPQDGHAPGVTPDGVL